MLDSDIARLYHCETKYVNHVVKNNIEVITLTSNHSNIKNIDIQKFNKEYPILKVAKINKFHD